MKIRSYLYTLLFVLLCGKLYTQTLLPHYAYTFQNHVVADSYHAPTFDGGNITAIMTSANTQIYLQVMKTDVSGNIQWAKRYDLPHMAYGDILQAKDSTYILFFTVMNSHSYRMIRFDSTGQELFSYRYVLPPNYDCFTIPEVLETNTGHFIVAASLYDQVAQGFSMHLFELSSAGSMVWSTQHYNTFSASWSQLDTFSNGDIAIMGRGSSASTGHEGLNIARFTSSGNLLWARNYYIPQWNVNANDISILGDKIYAVFYADEISGNSEGVGLLKLNGDATVAWSYRFANAPYLDIAHRYTINKAGNAELVIAGRAFLKVDTAANILFARAESNKAYTDFCMVDPWTYSYTLIHNQSMDIFYSDDSGKTCNDTAISVTRDTFHISIDTLSGQQSLSVNVFSDKLLENQSMPGFTTICSIVSGISDEVIDEHLNIGPVPASAQLHISSAASVETVDVFNLSGQLVEMHAPRANEFDLSVTHLPSGIYFIRCRTANSVVVRKVMIQH